jgi:acetylglutamate kinase
VLTDARPIAVAHNQQPTTNNQETIMSYSSEQAEILTQALPYIQKYSGKTIVVKYGGHAMVDEDLKRSVMKDIVLLRYVGMNPILVHGGGPEITEVMRKVGKEPAFVNG